ncbi:hypothetical protein [Vibrio breoganii]|uniref:hypothetical protein n=1 Tax=Vibrio breoganii TaxID=553239 RepID=UPI000C8543D6|nr:hypothetical protein [Vibrio breoganii]PMM44857.1 hypothetical protein BCT52_10525 [Vibrio breoganii]
MLLSLVAFTSVFSVVSTVSTVAIKRFNAARRRANEKSEKLKLMSNHLHSYITAERSYEAIKNELMVKSHFYQQVPATARGKYAEEVLQMQADLNAKRTAYLRAQQSYLSLGKQIH